MKTHSPKCAECFMRSSIGTVLILLTVLLNCAFAFEYSVVDLGEGTAYGLNNNGEVVGVSRFGINVSRATLWSKGNVINLGTFYGNESSGVYSSAMAINDTGVIVGSSNRLGESVGRPAVWRNGSIGGFLSAGYGSATAINNSNRIGMQSDSQAAVYETSMGYSLEMLGVGGASGINNNGDVVGVSIFNGFSRAALWSNGTVRDLGTVGGMNSAASDINDLGQVVGYSYIAGNTHVHAALWENGLARDLGTLDGGLYSYAYGINNSGQIVGYSFVSENSAYPYHAVIWENGVPIDLNSLVNIPGYTLGFAMAINDKGQIAATGWTNGPDHAFLLTPIAKPVANAGPDQSVHQGAIVTLYGGDSSDPSGLQLAYSWQIVSKPSGSTAMLNNTTLLNPSFTADKEGEYVFQLTVNTPSGVKSLPDEVIVTTSNSAPIADAGPDQVITLVGTTVWLNGKQSYDNESDPVDYFWVMKTRPTSSQAVLTDSHSATPHFVADVNGTYEIALSVSDPWLASAASDSVLVTFNNVKPVAQIGNNQSVNLGDIVYLDGSLSSDANSDPLYFKWAMLSKPDGSKASLADIAAVHTSFVPDIAGTYVISLVVNDGVIDSNSSNITVTVLLQRNNAIQTVQDIMQAINSLEKTSFKNDNMVNALTNKLNAVLTDIDGGSYAKAAQKLDDDLLNKTDGCAKTGSPDKNDWLINCSAQAQIYPLVLKAINQLNSK